MVELTDYFIARRVVKRFCDTTDTFELPFGEMIVTPFYFAVLMDLNFTGESLVYKDSSFIHIMHLGV